MPTSRVADVDAGVTFGEQLSLSLHDEPAGMPALPARLGFPVATEAGRPFDDDKRLFEPWWPGEHAFMRRVGERVELHTERRGDALTAFPELREVAEGIGADGVIVEGTLLALDAEGRPDPRLLRRHLTAAATPRQTPERRQAAAPRGVTEGAFVASDLPYLEGRSLAKVPFVERRRLLEDVLPDSVHCVLTPGLVGEGLTLARAVASLGLDAISARHLAGRWRAGPAGDDWLHLTVAEPPDLPTRPLLVLLEKLPLGD